MHRAAAAAVLVLSVALFSGCWAFPAKHAGPAGAPPGQFLSRTITVAGKRHRYTVYLPPGYSHKTVWPVILSLHGSGQCGTDGTRPSTAGIGEALRAEPGRYPCIVVFPQTSEHLRYWTDDFDQALASLNQSVREFGGDPHRLYLTGYSLGGSGTWFLAARHPGIFAALVPVCGRIAVLPDRARDPLIHHLVTTRNLYAAAAARIGRTPVWVFHGQADPVIPIEQSRHITAALKSRGGNVRLTEYPGIGHNAWIHAYADPNLPRWLLSQRLSIP